MTFLPSFSLTLLCPFCLIGPSLLKKEEERREKTGAENAEYAEYVEAGGGGSQVSC